MRLDARVLLAPAVAVVILALVLAQTTAALRDSGTWAARTDAPEAQVNPYARLDHLLARGAGGPTPNALRDPFAYGAVARAGAPVERVARPVTPPPPPRPTLTAIIYDDAADPRASIRWNGRDYSVRPGGLFDDFLVSDITRDRVTLRRGGETIVLQLLRKGE